MFIENIRGLCNLKPQHQGSVLTIGNFDGVHKGHQALIQRLKETAALLEAPSMVMTFEPLPKEFFQHENPAPRLTRWREKFGVFEELGVDKVFIIHFNNKFAQLSSKDFIKDILWSHLKIKHVIVGKDFRFGFRREGTFDELKKAGASYGFSVEGMPDVLVERERVSSTLIREALSLGQQEKAEKFLGRPYTMSGHVVHGNKLGRELGFPTANIHLHRRVTPVHGIYVVRMHGIKSKPLLGVANVGTRPTIGGTRTLLEVHLFHFNETIYGKHVIVEFCKKLRDEERYDNLVLLKVQIEKDAKQARDYFIRCGDLKNE